MPHSLEKTIRELNDIKKRYGTLDNMVEELRKHPGFERINRATLSRWLRAPAERTAIAIQILNEQRSGKTFNVAIADSLWVLPVKIALAAEYQEFRRHIKVDEALLHTGSEVVLNIRETGGQAIEMLEAGEVDIAMGARNYGASGNIGYLCDITCAAMLGISMEPLHTRKEFFSSNVIGYPHASKLGDMLEDRATEWGILDIKTKPLLPSEYVKALTHDEVQCIVGWEPFISRIKDDVGNKLTLHDVNKDVLGVMHIGLFIDSKAVNMKLLFPFLKVLSQVIHYVENNKHHPDLLKAIRDVEGIPEKKTSAILSESRYQIDHFQVETLLTLRE